MDKPDESRAIGSSKSSSKVELHPSACFLDGETDKVGEDAISFETDALALSLP